MSGTWIDLPLSGGGGGSPYWKNAAATFAALPAGTVDGEVRLVLATHELYYWDAGSSTWKLVPTSAIDPNDIADTDSLDLVVTAGILSGNVRLSSDVASAGNVLVSLNVQSGGSPGIRAQLSDALIRGLFASDGTYIAYNQATGTFSLIVSAVLGLLSSTTNAITYDNTTGQFTFNPANVDHATLANLSADSHTQYALLAGRSGGQTMVGGTAASNNLTLSSTSNGTKGNVVISDPVQLPTRTTTQINALTPSAGQVVYNSTTDRPQIYVAGTTNAWVDLIGWGN